MRDEPKRSRTILTSDELWKRLKRQAKDRGMLFNSYILEILERAAAKETK